MYTCVPVYALPLMQTLKNWLPSLLLMATIFAFSSIPDASMPHFGLADYLVKKFSHAIGYALLALANLRGLGGGSYRLAWLMTVLFSASDEFHQSFVAGRHASIIDALVFDNLGAIAGLWLHQIFSHRINR